MAYQAIARKWRPKIFDDFVGQEAITQTLKNSIQHNRLHHAYLFCGTRGVGKTSAARVFARSLNCEHGPTISPCGTCDPCTEITVSRNVDVIEVDAASNTGVDNVKEVIIKSISTAPARDRFKIFIIDEVHMLSNAAFNALLKTLEEPPPRRIFILATTEPEALPDTIISRCQLFPFKHISPDKIATKLGEIVEAENFSVERDALLAIARMGEGSMRDAQSILDRVLNCSDGPVTLASAQKVLGVTDFATLSKVVEGISSRSPMVAFEVTDELISSGKDLTIFTRDLLCHFRDLLLIKIDPETSFVQSVESKTELLRQSGLFSETDLIRFCNVLVDTERSMKDVSNPRYVLEVTLVKLMEMTRLISLEAVLTRLDKISSSTK